MKEVLHCKNRIKRLYLRNMVAQRVEKSLRYFLVIAVLDMPLWAYIILGNHGISDFTRAFFGSLYFLFPLLVLRRCPFHVFAKWILTGRKSGNLIAYMKKAYGKKRLILLIIFVFGFISSFLIVVILS